MTVRELIDRLTLLAAVHGDDLPVTDDDGWLVDDVVYEDGTHKDEAIVFLTIP